ncbi:MAG: trypsin-like serine protease [Pseudomonadota bacterium]
MARVLGLGLAAALLLSACDQVRFPSADEVLPNGTDAQTPAAETEAEAPDPVVTPTEDVDEPELPEVDVTEAEDAEPPTPITDLAAINATLCGLPVRPMGDSPTVAEATLAQAPDEDSIDIQAVNGTAATLAAFPGLVKMEPKEFLPGGAIASGHCGATRIAETWFITAAHCLDDDYDEVTLITGVDNLANPMAVRVNAVSSLCHAAYGGAGGAYVNDIALLRILETEAEKLGTIPIARFGESDKALVPFNYTEADMAGWGITSFAGSLSNQLLTTRLEMTGTGPAAIGVRSVEGAGPCIGDSGGPLYVTEETGERTVVGVLSVVEQNMTTGGFCEGEYGARYTNVQGYLRWIEDVMAACDSGDGLCGY